MEKSVCWFSAPLGIELGLCCRSVRCKGLCVLLNWLQSYITVLCVPKAPAFIKGSRKESWKCCGKVAVADDTEVVFCFGDVTFSYICSWCLPCRAFLISLLITCMLSLLY